MQTVANLFEGIPGSLSEEHFAQLFRGNGVRIERIVSRGHHSPEGFWYDQETDEWVVVLVGSAKLQFDGDSRHLELHRGDHVFIPAHLKHRVVWTDPAQDTVWLAVHCRP